MVREKKVKAVNFGKIEKKWQREWAEAKIFQANEKGDKKKKYYVCEFFPYPSADYLHVGHMRNYAIGDLIARYKRMRGLDVLYPMGFDAFGLPAENAAIKNKTHPKKYAENAIKMIKKMMNSMGLSYDWTREIVTCSPEYYKWNQWIFLRMLEKGIAYRKKAPVNWCPKDETVLANEEVIDGKCWRCDTQVNTRHIEQWFLKITDYADQLLDGLDKLDWPERVKELQRNWIGRSEGTRVIFPIDGLDRVIEVFTTRADTIYGVTFLACAAQHEVVYELVKGTKYEKTYNQFLEKITVSEKLEVGKEKEGFFTGRYGIHPLTGEKLPIYAGNFVVADYGTGAVMGVPAHDLRDWEFAKKHKLEIKEVVRPLFGEARKDAEFRKTISAVISRKSDGKFLFVKWKKFGWAAPVIGGVEEGENIGKAAEREVLEETGYKVKFIRELGGEIESYFFADNKNVWRHRLDQPVLLELVEDKQRKIDKEEEEKHETIWLDADEALKNITHAYNAIGLKRYVTNNEAFIEDGVLINSDAFSGLDSGTARERISELLAKKGSGGKTREYKLRDWLISRQRYWGTPIPVVYCSSCGIVPVNDKDLPVRLPEKVKFGSGNPLAANKDFLNTKCPCCGEQARRETDTMGTFFDSSWYYYRYCSPHSSDVFDRKSVGYWMPIDQYVGGIEHAVLHLLYARFFTKFLRDLGWLVIDEPFTRLFNQGIVHKDGVRMSKSHGNTISTEEASKAYGIDTTRLFLMFVASPEKDMEWSQQGIEGMARVVRRFIEICNRVGGATDEAMEHKLNKTLKIVEASYERFEFNKGMVSFIELVNFLSEKERVPRHVLETCLLMISPIMPHLAEELWHKIGRASLIVGESWPKVDESKINDKLDEQEKEMDKAVSDIMNIINLVKDKSGTEPEKVFLYVLAQELDRYSSSVLEKRIGKPIKIFAVNDKSKYDPQGKSSKVKPGRPGIYVE